MYMRGLSLVLIHLWHSLKPLLIGNTTWSSRSVCHCGGKSGSYLMSRIWVFILGLCITGETRFFLGYQWLCVSGGICRTEPFNTSPCSLKESFPFSFLILLKRMRGGQKETKYQHSSGINLGFLVTSWLCILSVNLPFRACSLIQYDLLHFDLNH